MKIKSIVEVGGFFFHETHGMFDSMTSCWKSLTEEQHWEVTALIESYYKELEADPTKPAWATENFKKFMLIGYMKADDIYKYHLAYLTSKGDDSMFVHPPEEENVSSDASAKKCVLLGKYNGVAF